MEQLYFFNAANHNCQDVTCLHGGTDERWHGWRESIKVEGSKIALLLKNFQKKKASLVVLRELAAGNWEENTLAHIVLIPDAPLYGFRYAEFDFQNSFHCFPWSS